MSVQAPFIPYRHRPASEWPKLTPTATYDPDKKLVTVSNGFAVKEVLRADGFRWDSSSKTWQRNMTPAEFKEETSLLTSIGVSLDTATRQLLAEKPQPEVNTEGWGMVSPASVEGLRKARERLIALANAELPMHRGMKITDAADREALRNIATLIRQVLGEVA